MSLFLFYYNINTHHPGTVTGENVSLNIQDFTTAETNQFLLKIQLKFMLGVNKMTYSSLLQWLLLQGSS